MKPPRGLNAAGVKAWHAAADACEANPAPSDRFSLAIDRFAQAVDLENRLREEWRRLDCPVLANGGTTGKVVVPHPLIAMIAEAARNAARFGGYVGCDPRSHKRLGAIPGRPQERVPPRKTAVDEPPKVVPLQRPIAVVAPTSTS